MSGGRQIHAALAAVIVACGVAACGSDNGSAVGLGTAGCLSDQLLCQFKTGISTKADVQKALGNPQLSVGSSASSTSSTSSTSSMSNTWIYICQVISSQVIRNDQTIFDFDDSGVLSDITFLRQGTGSTPPPDCWEGGSGGTGGAM